MKTEAVFRWDFALDAKADVREDDGAIYIEGYASDFGMDRQDEAFEPGAFEKGMKDFMANPILLYHHKYDHALGQVEEFEHRPLGLWVKARIDKPEPGTFLADVTKKIARGTIRAFSVGGKFRRRKGMDGRPRIYAADIAEVSVTPLPINPRTLFAVAGKAFGDTSELDKAMEGLAAVGESFKQARTALESGK